MHDLFDSFAYDIKLCYQAHRAGGDSRSVAISRIREDYAPEMQDMDDRVAVLMALALALCRKKELITEISEETLCAISEYRSSQELDSSTKKHLAKMEAKLRDPAMFGPEAHYARRRQYIPDWQLGDLFFHSMTCPQAAKTGLQGWSVLFYKVGEFTDDLGRLRHLMYVSLCPPGKEPTTDWELEQLGYLRMMHHGDKYDYLVQITPKSRNDESGYGFTKIGNFMKAAAPLDRTEENPLVSMPMFAHLRKDDKYPHYEEHICLLYKKLGMSQPPTP